MMEAAAHLVDHVLPMVPYRQFVISFPIPLRYWLNSNRKLYAKVHRIVIKQLHAYYTTKAKQLGMQDPSAGSISFTQRWGSACNLNPHMHVICPEGVYVTAGDHAVFRKIEPINDGEVANLLEGIAGKVLGLLKRHGFLDEDGEIVLNPLSDRDLSESEAISQATAASLAGKIAFGPNAGNYVTKIGSGFGYGEEIPLAKGHRCFSRNGFSLHANTSTKTQQRDQLEKLIQYIARGPLSNERLEIMEGGQVRLRLKTSWSDGTTHLEFTPSEFIEKLVALIPPPKTHLVRWGGVFAPNSRYRHEITLAPEIKKGIRLKSADGEDRLMRNSSWSKILARAFKIDVNQCNNCSGEMRFICAVKDPDSIRRYLVHLNVPYDPPARAPPRLQHQDMDFADSASLEVFNED